MQRNSQRSSAGSDGSSGSSDNHLISSIIIHPHPIYDHHRHPHRLSHCHLIIHHTSFIMVVKVTTRINTRRPLELSVKKSKTLRI